VLLYAKLSIKLLMEIFEASSTFDFESISLANPQPVQGGSFFTRATTNTDKPLYVQLPKCYTKNGIITTKRGKYSDLLYEKHNQETLVSWALSLEKTCHGKIYDKRTTWFHNELSLDDIETMMSPIFRLYKSGTKLLIRSYVDVRQHNNTDKCLAYDENEVLTSLDTINEETPIIPLVLIEGIKFSSKSFEIVIKLIQLMILNKDDDTSQICLIKHKKEQPITKVTIVTGDKDNDNISENSESTTDSIKSSEKNKPSNTESNIKIVTTETPDSENENIKMKVEDKTLENVNTLEHIAEVVDFNNKTDNIEEVNINVDDTTETLNLKRPNEVYYEIYRAARTKAKHMRKIAMEAYLEAKDIKAKYVLDIDDSDDENNSFENEDIEDIEVNEK